MPSLPRGEGGGGVTWPVPVFELEQAPDGPDERIHEEFFELERHVRPEGRTARARSHAGHEIAQPRSDPDAAGRDDLFARAPRRKTGRQARSVP